VSAICSSRGRRRTSTSRPAPRPTRSRRRSATAGSSAGGSGAKIIETSTFRANPRDDDDHDLLIRRDNVFGTETEDARRRDFTINGLFYDVEREEVIDHVGGLADLDAKLMRTIGDPDIRFQEDPVRILRAIKFAARLDFGFEPATWRALLRWRGEISKCAPPRLLEEVHRLMRGGAARRSFELMVETVPRRPARGRRRAGDRAADRRRPAARHDPPDRVRRGGPGGARSRRPARGR
jgi:poly(A) polymerase